MGTREQRIFGLEGDLVVEGKANAVLVEDKVRDKVVVKTKVLATDREVVNLGRLLDQESLG
jgi:hypothetical protein